MKCPYCESTMLKGVIEGDGRMPFRWLQDGEKLSIMDRIIGQKNIIAKCRPFSRTTLIAHRCDNCLKIIIDIKFND